MDPSVLQWEGWRRATDAEFTEAGKRIAADLQGVSFERVEETTPGSRTAFFAIDGSEFVLVPGGKATLGYEAGMFALSQQDMDALSQSGEFEGEEEVRAAEAGLAQSLPTLLSPRRTTQVAALLVETEAATVEEQSLPDDDPLFAELIRLYRQDRAASREIDGLRYRVVDRGGQLEVLERPTLAHISKLFSEHGARLLTEDEWEWCSGAGVNTLYRWGNRMPVEEEPTGQDSGEEKADLLEPNAFGLVIGWNPYAWESCDTAMKGGDGGKSWGGGQGTLRIWASLMIPHRLVRNGDLLGGVRRCIPVSI